MNWKLCVCRSGDADLLSKLRLLLLVPCVALFALVACDSNGDEEVMAAGQTMTNRLATVQERGTLICASRNDVPGYGSLDESGRNIGFDIDLCRAVAAAVLGDSEAIQINFITAAERGPTIQSGEVDLLVRTVTWTTSRDSQWGNYVHTMFYDGQGFMVPADLGITSAYELGGASVCVTSGTTTELNMSDFFRQNNLEYNPKVFEDTDVVLDSYKEGQCDVFTNDRSQLAALRSALPNPDDHVILPETISEEPLTPVVPHGDEQWFDIVKTVMSGLIYAEAYGNQQRQRREHGKRRQRQGEAPARNRGKLRPGDAGSVRDIHAGRDIERGQLRSDIRPQPGTAGNRPASGRPQRPLAQWRPDIRSAVALIGPTQAKRQGDARASPCFHNHDVW